MEQKRIVKKLVENINKEFKRLPHTIYQLMIVNDKIDKTFNFFVNFQKKGESIYSRPVYKYKEYDLADLESLLQLLNQENKLTRIYVGFDGLRWPSTGNKIK